MARRRAHSIGTAHANQEINFLGSDENTPLLGRPTRPFPALFARFRKNLQSATPPHKRFFKEQEQYESLDYEESECQIDLEARCGLTERDVLFINITRWVIIFIIGVVTAVIAFLIDFGILHLASSKFAFISSSIAHCVKHDCLVTSYFSWLAIDVVFVAIAACLVCFVEPCAMGSGIPEVKCYLNGIKMPNVVRFKTLVTKTVGVLFSVAGGLAVGKEGPMIHSGAVVAAGVSQGKSTTLPFINTGLFKAFRTDKDKRDFVSAGAAAGVSAAFGAPIGGVLFSLEEGASFWNQSLTWRIFFCSMTATFVLNVLLSGFKEGVWGALSNPGLINFGKFPDMPYSLYELPLFAIIGCIGGLLGALFNEINHRLTIFRMRYIHTRVAKLSEALAIAALTVSIAFTLMFFSQDCLPLGDAPSNNPLQFFCKEHQYNAMASLLFNTPEDSIKNLFHGEADEFKPGTLAMFFLTYFILACWTYGLAVPSGLFVPCILTGAAWGRFLGSLLLVLAPHETWVEPGKYALIGAAAMLGGVVRMTISLTVIIIEATGNVTYGLPIIVAVIFAKWVGDYFNEGLYDIHIEIKHVPLLGWEAPDIAKWNLRAVDFMNRKLHCVRMVSRVEDIYSMLRLSKHNAFPVVEWGFADGAGDFRHGVRYDPATFKGIILRAQLTFLLQQKCFGDLNFNGTVKCKPLTMRDFRTAYPRFPLIQDITLTKKERNKFLDLTPYVNPSPYVVLETSSLSRIFRLFRTMGLRHLVIVDYSNHIVGLVTRKDIANITPKMTKAHFTSQRAEVAAAEYLMPEHFTYHALPMVQPDECAHTGVVGDPSSDDDGDDGSGSARATNDDSLPSQVSMEEYAAQPPLGSIN